MILNGILVLGIIVSFVWYFYFKTKQLRTTLPIRRKWYTSKASICLGAFIFFFGLNFMLIYQSTLTYVISIIFVLIGGYFMYYHYKAAKHYGQFVQEELSLNQ